MFKDCTNLKTVRINSTNLSSIGSNTFYGCTSLVSIELPGTITSISTGLFNGCTALEQIVIPSKVRSIGNSAFKDCTSLSNIVIPKTVIGMGTNVFEGWTSAQTINIEALESEITYGTTTTSNWNTAWNEGCEATVVWGYKGA